MLSLDARSITDREFRATLGELLPALRSPVLIDFVDRLWMVVHLGPTASADSPWVQHVEPIWRTQGRGLFRHGPRFAYFAGGWVSKERPGVLKLPAGASWVSLAGIRLTSPAVNQTMQIVIDKIPPFDDAVFAMMAPGIDEWKINADIPADSSIRLEPAFDDGPSIFGVLFAYLDGDRSLFPTFEDPPPSKGT